MPPRTSTRNKAKAEDKPPKKDVDESEEEDDDDKKTKGKKGSKTAAKAESKAKGKKAKDADSDEDKKDTKAKGKGKGKGAKGGKRKADESDEDESDDDKKKPSKKVKGDDDDKKVTKVITKGGAAVDKFVPVDDVHVYIDGKDVYAKTLNQSNLNRNNNKFYIIQVLQSDKDKNKFWTWNRWGRVGSDGQNALKAFSSADAAIKDFDKKHHDKTVKGDYVEIDINYDDDDGDDKDDDKDDDKSDDDKRGKKGKKVSKKAAKDESESEEEEEEEDKKDSVKKVVTKGGVAIDEYFPDKDCTVYIDKTRAWSATLNQSNLGRNNNKFYIIQILESNKDKGTYYVWNRWGRVGAAGQNKKTKYTDINQAIADFNNKHRDKTVKGDYVEIDINYDDGAEEEEETKDDKKEDKKEEEKKSKLPAQVKDLVKLIFDLKMMNAQMKEIGYDASKTPLGKLSKKAIQKGYEVLNDITKALKAGANSTKLGDLSSAFYTAIPHDFGFQKMSNFILNTEQKVKEKLDMLASLEEIQVATKLLDESSKGGEEALVDSHYAKLNCGLQPIDKNSEEFKLIQEYVKNTHAATHSSYGLEIEEVFTVDRAGEKERFNNALHNKQLLWHGSRLTNYVGILSQGLRIAPPEAPVTGYMFGKGVYFADMVSKSANYCFTNSQNNTGLMLLCEVALGDCNELFYADYNAGNLPPGKHSTKGCGRTAPAPGGAKKIDNGETLVPAGKGEAVNLRQGSLLYNEFIVYNINQIKMRYLLKMKFNYRY